MQVLSSLHVRTYTTLSSNSIQDDAILLHGPSPAGGGGWICVVYGSRTLPAGFLLSKLPRIIHRIYYKHYQFAWSQFMGHQLPTTFRIFSSQIITHNDTYIHVKCQFLSTRYLGFKLKCDNACLSFGSRHLVTCSLIFNTAVFAFETPASFTYYTFAQGLRT